MIILREKKQPLYETGYACTAQDNAGILILVNTRETPHERGMPHAHLQDMSARDVAHFFITQETPQTKNDLRFVKGTFKGIIPAKYKDALVAWANAPKKEFTGWTGWNFLKNEWARLRPSGRTPSPYPSKDQLENIG
jgi:hypothetical protein